MSDLLALAIGVLLLVCNAFFVGAEFALISARRSTVEPRAQEGSRRAKTALRAMENISLMLAGAQLGITICSLRRTARRRTDRGSTGGGSRRT